MDTNLGDKQAEIAHLQQHLATLQGKKEELVASMSLQSNALMMSPDAPRRPASGIVVDRIRERGCGRGCGALLSLSFLGILAFALYTQVFRWLYPRTGNTAAASNGAFLVVAAVVLAVIGAYFSTWKADVKWQDAKHQWDLTVQARSGRTCPGAGPP